jgi:hypothetical protein
MSAGFTRLTTSFVPVSITTMALDTWDITYP